MNDVIGIPEQCVREATFQEVHAQPRRVLNDQVQEDVYRLPVFNVVFCGPLLGQSQEGGRRKGQELFQPVLNVVVSRRGEKNSKDLVHGKGQAVNVVLVAVQLGLKKYMTISLGF